MSAVDEMTDKDVQKQLKELYTALDADTLHKAKAYEYNEQQLNAVNEILDGLGVPQLNKEGHYYSPAARLTYYIAHGCNCDYKESA